MLCIFAIILQPNIYFEWMNHLELITILYEQTGAHSLTRISFYASSVLPKQDSCVSTVLLAPLSITPLVTLTSPS